MPIKPTIPVEYVLQWAYRDGEYREPVEMLERPMGYGDMHPMWALAPRTHRSFSWGATAMMHAPHPDAVAIIAEINRCDDDLTKAAVLAVGMESDYLSDVAGMVRAEPAEFVARAFASVRRSVHVNAKLRSRPAIPDLPRPRPRLSQQRHALVLAPSTLSYDIVSGSKIQVTSDMAVKQSRQSRRRSYPAGSYCPIVWEEPTFEALAAERAEYLAWAVAVSVLGRRLTGKLASFDIACAFPPITPWLT